MPDNKNEKYNLFVGFVLSVVVILTAPLITILSINILFGTLIPLNFFTWFSMFWLHGIITGSTGQLIRKLNK